MAVGVVAGDAAAQPEHVAARPGVREDALRGRRASKPGVARLDLGVEQALLGGEQRAPPVDVDAAAFEDDRRGPCRRDGPKAAGRAAAPRARGRGRRFCQSSYFAQPLKRKRAMATSGPRPSRRTKIGPKSRVQPRSVGKRRNSTRREVHAGALQHAPRAAPRGRRDWTRMRTRLAGRELADDLAVDPGDGRELARPVARVVRPGDPGGLVRLPLGGHAEPAGGAVSAARQSMKRRVDAGVGVDAPVAEERPVAPHLLEPARGRTRRPGPPRLSAEASATHDAERIGRRTTPPRTRGRPARRRPLVADAVHRRDVDAVGDGVRRAGWSARRRAGRRRTRAFSRRVPADGGRIEEDVRALQRGQARALRDTTGPSR